MQLVRSRVGQYAHDYDREGKPLSVIKSVDISSCCDTLNSKAVVDFYWGSPNNVLYFNLWLKDPRDNRIHIECSQLRSRQTQDSIERLLDVMDMSFDTFAGIIECIAPDVPLPQVRKKRQKARRSKSRPKKKSKRRT